MPNYQMTMFFNLDQWGWTESWYLVQASRAAANEKALDIAYYRAALTPAAVTMMAVRIQDVALPGDDGVEFARDSGRFGPQPTNEPAVPWAAWLCKFQTADFRRRNLLLRGVPKSTMVYTSGSKWRAPPEIYKGDFDNYMKALVRNGAAIRTRRNNPNDAANKQVEALSRDVSSGIWLTVEVTNHQYVAGDKVAFTKVKDTGKTKVTGIHRVVKVITGNLFNVDIPATQPTYPAYTGTGRVRLVEYDYPAITGGNILRMVKKSTGGPFFGTVGRQ